ncbi:hypothetical protein [Treponema sp. R8-4-B8]
MGLILKLSAVFSHNVPAVTDGFVFAIRKLRKQFLANTKLWRNKNAQRAKPDCVFV